MLQLPNNQRSIENHVEQNNQSVVPGCLYVVPTPIGNLQDITQRALSVLAEVDWVAAEDTRHSKKLFQHYGIEARFLSLHEHNESQRSSLLIDKLLAGDSVALISDAGTPLISDPGYVLVNRCREKGIQVSALPGPCAAITALSAAGLPTDKFTFKGFFPVKQQALESVINSLAESQITSVYYEAPRRVLQTLSKMAEMLSPEQEIVIAKEISKTFETYQSGSATEVLEWLQEDTNHQRGEFVVIVGPAPQKDNGLPVDALGLLKLLLPQMPPKKASAIVAEHYGVKKNQVYTASLNLNRDDSA
jgi:16S rRNA (cytidine1402-2'-O)-methyltransferase